MRIALALALSNAALFAQPQAPTFRAGTKLVEVTVAVLDKKGNPVTGLSQSDFTVEDGGKAQPIAFFRFDGLPARPEALSPAPGLFTNRIDNGGTAPPSVTALVLDTLNTPQELNALIRAQTMRYLKTLGPASRVAVFLMDWDLRVLYDFTGNGDVLRARIEKLTLGAPSETTVDPVASTVEAADLLKLFEGTDSYPIIEKAMRAKLDTDLMANSVIQRNRMDISLSAMEALGSRLAGIPGRKSIVWMSSGFSMASVTGIMGMGPNGDIQNFEEKVRRTAQRLAQDGVILYIVDPGGVRLSALSSAESSSQPSIARGGGASGRATVLDRSSDTQDMNADTRGSAALMTGVTGGRYLTGTNDLTVGFRQALADIRGSYTLGFYAHETADNKWHKLKVGVKRPGVNVRHRQGYLAEATSPQPIEWDEAAWNAAFSNPVGSSIIPMSAQCERTAAGETSVALNIDSGSISFRPDGENLRADLQVAFWDGGGRSSVVTFKPSLPAAQAEKTRSQEVVYTRQLKPSQGAAILRVVVHDMRTGMYGTLDIPLNQIPAAIK